MAKIRLLGLRARLENEVLPALQRAGVLHPVSCTVPGPALGAVPLTPRHAREAAQLRRAAKHIEEALKPLGAGAVSTLSAATPFSRAAAAAWLRRARNVCRAAQALADQRRSLEEERTLIEKYRGFFAAFQALMRHPPRPGAAAYFLLLRKADPSVVERLRKGLADAAGAGFELRTKPLPGGETALVALAPPSAAARVEGLLGAARIDEVPIPPQYGASSLSDAIPAMKARLAALPAELRAVEVERCALAEAHGGALGQALASLADRIAVVEALPLARVTRHAFVIDGWVPELDRDRLFAGVTAELGETAVFEELGREKWTDPHAPVVLSNPGLFRPFETLVRFLPLPRYGTVDPTPFVGVFFPMFFGLILGDVGYGALLAALAVGLRLRSAAASRRRAVAGIAGACAAFSIAFGWLYGELFGDAGRRYLGLRPLLFGREEALLPFLALAVAIGLVHVLLGLVLGLLSAVHVHPRRALGRGVAAIMVALVAIALLAAAGVLPSALFSPAVVVLLAAFPVLVALEGLLGPIEFLAALGNVLSYARIMALGTASVMLAVVANRMAGAMGSVAVGALFGLLFHLVNFALGVFGPTVHALRLHYVEFFGKFYGPGGIEYRPLRAASGPRPAAGR
jgi:V/A-type H+-transporting ATPase subunit I